MSSDSTNDDDSINTPPNETDSVSSGEAPIENAAESQPEEFELGEDYDPDIDELNRQGSSIGNDSKKTLLTGAVIVIGAIVMLYNVFSDPPPQPVSRSAGPPVGVSNQMVNAPSLPPTVDTSIPSLPPAPPPPPPPPPPPAPPPPPPAPAPAAAVGAGTGAPAESRPNNPPPPVPKAPLAPPEVKAIAPQPRAPGSDRKSAERMRSNMLLLDGGANISNDGAAERAANSKDSLKKNDPNSRFEDDAIEASQVKVVKAGKLDNLNNMIAQGKILNAVLETAINTDLPGTLRAIVSRDVYAEAGKTVLIPKGSRLIGTYNTGVLRGQKRVMVVWTRVIRPDGIDMMIASPGVDSLGRAGIAGQVDNKYMESFSAAILTSMISLGVAVIADASLGDSTTTTTAGSTTNSNSAGAGAASNSADALGDVGNEIVRGMLDLRPTITVDQGTRINVFVNRDLLFPGDVKEGVFVE